jgi:hypothetical protein
MHFSRRGFPGADHNAARRPAGAGQPERKNEYFSFRGHVLRPAPIQILGQKLSRPGNQTVKRKGFRVVNGHIARRHPERRGQSQETAHLFGRQKRPALFRRS